MADQIDVEELLQECGALLKGHFVLSSGRHSDLYVEKFRLLERPRITERLCKNLVKQLKGQKFHAVAGPLTGGILLAFEIARQLDVQAIYVENENGLKKVRRNSPLPENANVLVVDDVLTTGLSLHETITAVQAIGGNVGAVAVLIDRSETHPELGCEIYAACRIAAKSYTPDEVPDWLQEIPVRQPGTRHLSS
ncbi:MAG: orotate phosphoribosyltransferase [Fimbriimonadaceae bacterium]